MIKENTKPHDFKLHTEQRAIKRAMFNYSVTIILCHSSSLFGIIINRSLFIPFLKRYYLLLNQPILSYSKYYLILPSPINLNFWINWYFKIVSNQIVQEVLFPSQLI